MITGTTTGTTTAIINTMSTIRTTMISTSMKIGLIASTGSRGIMTTSIGIGRLHSSGKLTGIGVTATPMLSCKSTSANWSF